MKDLKDMTPAELRKYADELERKQKYDSLPKPLETVDYEPIEALCNNFLMEILEDGWADEDFNVYLSEEVLKAIYGPHIFTWINKNSK